MSGKACVSSSPPDLFVDREWCDGAAGHVVRVFEADESGGCAVVYLRSDGVADLRPGEDAALAGDGSRRAAGEGGHHRHLPVEDM